MKPFYKTNRYGKYSITVSAVESWNKIQKQLKDLLLRNLPPNKIKTIVSDLYLHSLIMQKLYLTLIKGIIAIFAIFIAIIAIFYNWKMIFSAL